MIMGGGGKGNLQGTVERYTESENQVKVCGRMGENENLGIATGGSKTPRK